MSVQLLSPEILAGLFQLQEIALFEINEADRLILTGDVPAWLKDIWPDAGKGNTLDCSHRFYYLEHFLNEVEVTWQSSDSIVYSSDLWQETGREGKEWLLEAVAARQGDQRFLVLRPAKIYQEEFRHIIQQGRALDIEHDHLIKAVNRRDVLLHCMVHDLSTPLASIKGSLQLLFEILSENERELAEIGLRQTSKMQHLIRDVSTSLSNLTPGSEQVLNQVSGGTDVYQVVHQVVKALTPVALLKDVKLIVECETEDGLTWKVLADPVKLERVFFNIIENATRHTPAGSSVTVRLHHVGNSIRCSVEDEGSGVTDEMIQHLFEKDFQGQQNTGKQGLGLYFCRIAVEGWGGSIGYKPGRKGGACFWFNLLKYRE